MRFASHLQAPGMAGGHRRCRGRTATARPQDACRLHNREWGGRGLDVGAEAPHGRARGLDRGERGLERGERVGGRCGGSDVGHVSVALQVSSTPECLARACD